MSPNIVEPELKDCVICDTEDDTIYRYAIISPCVVILPVTLNVPAFTCPKDPIEDAEPDTSPDVYKDDSIALLPDVITFFQLGI